jgi:hypothetical protein
MSAGSSGSTLATSSPEPAPDEQGDLIGVNGDRDAGILGFREPVVQSLGPIAREVLAVRPRSMVPGVPWSIEPHRLHDVPRAPTKATGDEDRPGRLEREQRFLGDSRHLASETLDPTTEQYPSVTTLSHESPHGGEARPPITGVELLGLHAPALLRRNQSAVPREE